METCWIRRCCGGWMTCWAGTNCWGWMTFWDRMTFWDWICWNGTVWKWLYPGFTKITWLLFIFASWLITCGGTITTEDLWPITETGWRIVCWTILLFVSLSSIKALTTGGTSTTDPFTGTFTGPLRGPLTGPLTGPLAWTKFDVATLIGTGANWLLLTSWLITALYPLVLYTIWGIGLFWISTLLPTWFTVTPCAIACELLNLTCDPLKSAPLKFGVFKFTF